MEIFETLDFAPQAPCSLALGAFDGLHPGHLAVIRAALEGGLPAAVFTFPSAPSGEPTVVTAEDKAGLLAGLGVERVYSVEFEALRNMEAADFVERVLFQKINARRLCCGEDFRFGRGAAGDAALLRALCERRGAELRVVPPVKLDGEKISSTRVRQAVEAGNIPQANRLLGRPFGFELEVIHGNHIGTGLGTPTINQALPQGFVLPRFGVYAAWCQVEGALYYGVCNIGVKPTVGSDRVLAETWMPEFQGDLYGRRVRLFLLDFIRPEKKFASLDQLKEEIRRNAQTARTMALAAPLGDGAGRFAGAPADS